MSERGGLWSLLAHPIVYELFHHCIGARRWLKRFAAETIRPGCDDRVFDVGCGSGALLHYLPPTTTYVGFDRNEMCIERARRVHGSRGEFVCDDVRSFNAYAPAPADIVVAIGILHHLDDDLVSSLLEAIVDALKPGGRLITVDPCFHVKQTSLQRFVVHNDRGLHVRPFEQYLNLVKSAFPQASATFEQGHFPLPHSICIIQAARASAGQDYQ